jgi:hypothetical protein
MRATLGLAVALPACSLEPITFRGDIPFDAAAGALEEDCTRLGDEDGNGVADCRDPACATEYCVTASGCDVAYIDRVAFTAGTASKWFGGDDRPGFVRTIGTGESVTPDVTLTMYRFGFRFSEGFLYSMTREFGRQPNTLQLDRRDPSGQIVESYLTTLPAKSLGGWVYWNTPPTRLDAGTPYLFTASLVDAFGQKVNSATLGDTEAGYAGGAGYSGQASSGDLSSWSLWFMHPWDFQFRVQERSPACIATAAVQ